MFNTNIGEFSLQSALNTYLEKPPYLRGVAMQPKVQRQASGNKNKVKNDKEEW